MSNKVRQNPDGSISVMDERYRVNERDKDQFDVVRERDGVRMGSFRLLPDVGVEAEGEHKEVVQAVADILAVPRAPVPLQ